MIEVMSQNKFSSKRIGYMTAAQCYNEKTEVITLATNLIRKVTMQKKKKMISIHAGHVLCQFA
jgi:hypothetical protein